MSKLSELLKVDTNTPQVQAGDIDGTIIDYYPVSPLEMRNGVVIINDGRTKNRSFYLKCNERIDPFYVPADAPYLYGPAYPLNPESPSDTGVRILRDMQTCAVKDDGLTLLAARININGTAEIFKSSDGGAIWSLKTSMPLTLPQKVEYPALMYSNGRWLFFSGGIGEYGVSYSTNDGDKWIDVSGGERDALPTYGHMSAVGDDFYIASGTSSLRLSFSGGDKPTLYRDEDIWRQIREKNGMSSNLVKVIGCNNRTYFVPKGGVTGFVKDGDTYSQVDFVVDPVLSSGFDKKIPEWYCDMWYDNATKRYYKMTICVQVYNTVDVGVYLTIEQSTDGIKFECDLMKHRFNLVAGHDIYKIPGFIAVDIKNGCGCITVGDFFDGKTPKTTVSYYWDSKNSMNIKPGATLTPAGMRAYPEYHSDVISYDANYAGVFRSVYKSRGSGKHYAYITNQPEHLRSDGSHDYSYALRVLGSSQSGDGDYDICRHYIQTPTFPTSTGDIVKLWKIR